MESATPERRRHLFLGASCVLIGLVASWFGYRYLRDYLEAQPDTGDYQADVRLLARLSEASFVPPTDAARAADDWPQWRGPNRDGVARGTGLLSSWPSDGPRVVWKAETGEGYSSPIVAGGRVFLLVQQGENEAVVCRDAGDGRELWRHAYPARFHNAEAGTGPHSTPAVAGDCVYTVGATGKFHCLDVRTGTVRWVHDLLAEFQVTNQEYGVSFSPLIEGNRVVTMPGGPNGSSVVAFDRIDGRLVWKALDDRAGYSSPVAATLAGRRQVVCLTAESVVGLAPEDGKLLWKYPWPLFKDCNVATPVVVGDYVFISSGYSKGCSLLEITADGGAAFHARPVYEHNRMRNHFSTSVIYGDHLYGFDDFFLAAMDLRTGKVLWKERGFGKGTLLAADGRLIILGDNGRLVLADASPVEFRERARCKLLHGRCWTMPALAGGKLYIRDEKSILCLDLRAGP